MNSKKLDAEDNPNINLIDEEDEELDKPKLASRLTKVQLGKRELPSYSDDDLSSFKFGIYMDNGLTYMIRIEDKLNFDYLLR